MVNAHHGGLIAFAAKFPEWALSVFSYSIRAAGFGIRILRKSKAALSSLNKEPST